MARRGAAGEPAADSEATAKELASRLPQSGSPVRQQASDGLREPDAVDQAIYSPITATATPSPDEPPRRLSSTASNSRLWLATADKLAMTAGQKAARATVQGTLAIGPTSALVNLAVKSIWSRRRPDRVGAGVPSQRNVQMPDSTSFLSGHAASGFAFASAIGREQPWLGSALGVLAAAVAYSRVPDGIDMSGDPAVLGRLMSLIDNPDPDFAIVTP